MSWVILALTLGASITSMIHGVFMLFETLVNNALIIEISNKALACMTVASGIFALIGGIIAFNRSKWGALFLFIAAGLCIPSKDMWIYSGIYLFAMLLCFFIKSERHEEYEYDDLLYEEEYENNGEFDDAQKSQTPSYYFGNESENYDAEEESVDYLQGGFPELPKPELKEVIKDPILNDDVAAPVINNEPPKLRRRMQKTCPTCGATVARDARFCSTCGAALIVPTESLLEAQNNDTDTLTVKEIKTEIKDEKSAPAVQTELTEMNFAVNDINFNANDGDDMAQANKVLVKPRREPQGSASRQRTGNNIDAAASSYQEFSKYTRRAKKRKRSAGRKILSMILLLGAVGGALYFLLGLRKLPDAELPPIVRNALLDAEKNENNNNSTAPSVSENTNAGKDSQTSAIAVQQNTDIAVPGRTLTENILPDFTPDREPKSGIVVGSNVNVRSDHSTSSNRIARLNVNSKIEIIGNYNVTSGQYQGIWYNVMTGGKEGWIYGRYVQPTGSGLPAGYSNALLKSFGSNKTQLAETLGQPSRNSSTSAEWQGLTATLKGEEITRIRITNSKHELQNGLKVGMSQTAVLQIMGFPSGVSNKILQYSEGGKNGVSVQLDKNNAVSSITVNKIN